MGDNRMERRVLCGLEDVTTPTFLNILGSVAILPYMEGVSERLSRVFKKAGDVTSDDTKWYLSKDLLQFWSLVTCFVMKKFNLVLVF